jgi:hypothetical protein
MLLIDLDLFTEEETFSDTMRQIIKDYVTPLIDSRGIIVSGAFIKNMFEDLTKLHTNTNGFLETVKMDMKLYKTEEQLQSGIINIIENMV